MKRTAAPSPIIHLLNSVFSVGFRVFRVALNPGAANTTYWGHWSELDSPKTHKLANGDRAGRVSK